VIIGRDFAGEMQATFANDLAVSAAIDLERWERRPLSFRFKEWMARVWGRLL
jgi:cardiolipin synthase